jgi:hypothetical protein
MLSAIGVSSLPPAVPVTLSDGVSATAATVTAIVPWVEALSPLGPSVEVAVTVSVKLN